MFHAGVDKNELVAFRIEREVLVLQGFAVEEDEAAGLTEARSELVHNAALHAAVVVLGALADLGEFELVDGPAVEQVIDGESEGALKGGRRREACAERHVAGKNGIEAFNLAATLDGFAAHAEDVASPESFRLVRLFKSEFGIFVEVQGVSPDLIGSVRLDFSHYALVDGSREDVASVVVGVLADEVDTSGGSIDRCALPEERDKFFVNSVLHFIKC